MVGFSRQLISIQLRLPGGVRCLLVDTGAGLSLLKEPIRGLPLEGSCVVARGVTGNNIPVNGLQRLKLDCGEGGREQIFVIADFALDYDGILGLDAMENLGLVVDLANRTIRCGMEVVKEIKVVSQVASFQELSGEKNGQELNEKPDCRDTGPIVELDIETRANKVRVCEDTRIPARSQTVVRCMIVGKWTGQIAIVEPSWPDKGFWRAGRCISNVSNKRIWIPVVNLDEQEIMLSKSEAVGTALTWKESTDAAHREMKVDVASTTEQSEEVRRTLERLLQEKLDHLSEPKAVGLRNLVMSYIDVFQNPAENRLGCTTDTYHRIDTGEARPIAKAPYRVPYHQKEVLKELIEDMLDKEIIVPSDSPWSAPIVLVRKKTADGSEKYRFCTDFRGLNSVTKVPSYPLPNIHETLEGLGQSNWFTTLDLAAGYHQIRVAEEDQAKTAFSTPDGHYHYKRMAFGLAGAPATFQILMDRVLAGIKGEMCYVYLDDVIVYSRSMEEHVARLEHVLQRLRKANLRINLEKCHFAKESVKYLGHIVSRSGVQPDPDKISAVRAYKIPQNVKEVRAFLGLVGYYRRFIREFAETARPLTQLTKQDREFSWGTEEQRSFERLRNALCSEDVLAYPDFKLPFILSVDASGVALGAVLSQLQDGVERPIGYASRQLNAAERNYSATEKEMLAAVWATKYFRCYLYGRKFCLVTDHSALRWLLNVKDPSSRLARWQQRLAEFEYEAVYKPGKKHYNADALSRYVQPVVAVEWTADKIKAAQLKDQGCQKIKSCGKYQLEADESGVMFVSKQGKKLLIVPAEMKPAVLEWAHDAVFAGHPGVERTAANVLARYTWPNVNQEIKRYVEQCVSCSARNTHPRKRAPLGMVYEAKAPFEFVSIDIVGPLPPGAAGGFRYILTCIDHFSRYCEAIPLVSITAQDVGRALIERIIVRHGVPNKLLTDQGANFTSSLIKEMCSILGVKKLQTTPYHPQCNGMVERFHRTVINMISHYVREDGSDWPKWLPLMIMAYNATPHSSTGYTPFYLLNGRELRKPVLEDLPADNNRPRDIEEYLRDLQRRMKEAFEVATERSRKSHEENERRYNRNAKRPEYSEGQWVYLHCPVAPSGVARKFYKPWKGPFRIVDCPDKLILKLEITPDNYKVVNVDRVKPCKREVPLEMAERSKDEEEEEADYSAPDTEDGMDPLEWAQLQVTYDDDTPAEEDDEKLFEAPRGLFDDGGDDARLEVQGQISDIKEPISPSDDSNSDPSFQPAYSPITRPRSPYWLRSQH